MGRRRRPTIKDICPVQHQQFLKRLGSLVIRREDYPVPFPEALLSNGSSNPEGGEATVVETEDDTDDTIFVGKINGNSKPQSFVAG